MLSHVRVGSGRTVRWAAMALVALFSLSGCLIKPHALNKEDVKARVVKDFHTFHRLRSRLADRPRCCARVEVQLGRKGQNHASAAGVSSSISHYSLLPASAGVRWA